MEDWLDFFEKRLVPIEDITINFPLPTAFSAESKESLERRPEENFAEWLLGKDSLESESQLIDVGFSCNQAHSYQLKLDPNIQLFLHDALDEETKQSRINVESLEDLPVDP